MSVVGKSRIVVIILCAQAYRYSVSLQDLKNAKLINFALPPRATLILLGTSNSEMINFVFVENWPRQGKIFLDFHVYRLILCIFLTTKLLGSEENTPKFSRPYRDENTKKREISHPDFWPKREISPLTPPPLPPLHTGDSPKLTNQPHHR